MYIKLFQVFTFVIIAGCGATYNQRLAVSKTSIYFGQSAERENLKAILKTLKPATNKMPELYHIRLQKSGINAYYFIMSWIIGDVKVKKFNMIDHKNEGNIFVFGKEMFSPNNIEHISTFSAYFI